MKKIMYFLLLNLFAFNSLAANNFLCGYADIFHLNDDNYPGLRISSSFSSNEVYLHLIDSNKFEIKDRLCKEGHVDIMTLSQDYYRYCWLTITDGPWLMNPFVSNTVCFGMRFKGLNYEGYNKEGYIYSLHFD